MRVLTALVAFGAAVVLAAPARAQSNEIQSVEIAPIVGLRMGSTFDVGEVGPTYGLSAGVRFDDYSLVEIRWTRGEAGDISQNQFHADFTREFPVEEVRGLRSFLTGSLGLTHFGAGPDGFTRFSFGLSGGLKQLIGSRLAIRAEAQWLPIVFQPSVSAFCGSAQFGGCALFFHGSLLQQFQVGVGPVIRF